MKESLRVIGLRESVYWLSWLLIYLLIAFLMAAIIALLFRFGGIFSVNAFPAIAQWSILQNRKKLTKIAIHLSTAACSGLLALLAPSAALAHFARSLTYSLARGTVIYTMAFLSVFFPILDHI